VPGSLLDRQIDGHTGIPAELWCVWSLLRTAQFKQESRAVAREPRDAAAVGFGLKFADNIHYKFKSSKASKARLQSSKRIGAVQNLTQHGHSRSRVLESVERR